MQYKDKVYSQVLKCNQPDQNLTLLYKKLRTSVVKDIKLCMSNYLKNYFLCNRNNMRNIWSEIRSIINVSKGKADYIPTLLENGKLIDNPFAIARAFNNVFVNVSKNTNKDIYLMGATVLLLFPRKFSLTQCFLLMLLHMRLNPTYLKWTVRNLLFHIVFQFPC